MAVENKGVNRPDEQELWRLAKLIRQSMRELDRQLNSKKTR